MGNIRVTHQMCVRSHAHHASRTSQNRILGQSLSPPFPIRKSASGIMRASTYFPLAPLIVAMFVDSTIAVQTTCFQVSECTRVQSLVGWLVPEGRCGCMQS
jgi:hypothetical protein